MYVILVNDDNSLQVTQKTRIMQRSKLVDDLWFLSNPVYKGYDMTPCTVMLEYLLPVSKSYKSEILVMSEDTYNGHLKYVLPVDTELTSEAGQIEVQLTFALVDIDERGRTVQRVRKTSPTVIDIVPISAWSDIIPDAALSAIDQRLIKTDAQIKALADIGELINATKADNIKYNSENGELQLLANNKEIGNKIVITSINSGGTGDAEDNSEGYDIIMF